MGPFDFIASTYRDQNSNLSSTIVSSARQHYLSKCMGGTHRNVQAGGISERGGNILNTGTTLASLLERDRSALFMAQSRDGSSRHYLRREKPHENSGG